MAKDKKSDLQEHEGVSGIKTANTSSILNIKEKRKAEVFTEHLIVSILNKDITALARAITVIESTHSKHSEKQTP
ncbi:hypothetical protein ACFFU9_10295 [Mariniflexile ostreae]|uniref:Clp R domain-containing protein n=1 Tax=Mariniflexile ostreae TaxID=1520892 RepID=A0ABV5FCF9_9FLAO